MYGRQADFKSTTLAIEVYHFADEWQIDHLAKAAGTFLEKTATLDEILPVFALFNSLGQEAGISRSLEVLYFFYSLCIVFLELTCYMSKYFTSKLFPPKLSYYQPLRLKKICVYLSN